MRGALVLLFASSASSLRVPNFRSPSVRMAAVADPVERDAKYGSPLNAEQYLVDLHDAKAPFDFCGGDL